MNKLKEWGGNRNGFCEIIENQSFISIIIVTYNADKFIENCLQSIAAQSFQNFELLIFDGKSTDNTINILKKYDHIISYWQSEPDNGIYDAMNKALIYAKGNWLYFLGADDVLLEGFSKMSNLLLNNKTLYYGFCLINNYPSGNKLTKYNLAKVNVCHHAVFYPAVIFKKYNYETRYKVYADHALNIQCWGDKTIKKKYYNLPIAIYNHDGYSSFSKDIFFKNEKLKWIKKYMGRLIYYRCLLKKGKEQKKGDTNFFAT